MIHNLRTPLRASPWLFGGAFALGAAVAFTAAAAMFDFQVKEAQLAVTAAQAQRDLWKDRYDDAIRAARPSPASQESGG